MEQSSLMELSMTAMMQALIKELCAVQLKTATMQGCSPELTINSNKGLHMHMTFIYQTK